MLEVRAVVDADAKASATLLNAIIADGRYTVMTGIIKTDEQLRYIRAFPTRGVFHVCVDTGCDRLLGLQSVEPVDAATPALAHVGDIASFVAPDVFRRGVGTLLTGATLQACTANGFEKLMATVRADNPGALRFYASQGFEALGTAKRHALIAGRYIDEVIMERQL